MICHSHQDAGWLSTIEEYYESQVKHILTNVIDALEAVPERTFTHAEIGFFNMWWNH